MSSDLFAFNMAENIPTAEIRKITGFYDPHQQVWVGGDEASLCDTFYCGTTTNDITTYCAAYIPFTNTCYKWKTGVESHTDTDGDCD
jgi:hypothetical protein